MNDVLESRANLETKFVCAYKNAQNEISIQVLTNAVHREVHDVSYIHGWSYKHERPVTLRSDRVLEVFSTVESAEEKLDFLTQENSVVSRNLLPEIIPYSSKNTFDVCFTGFDSKTKEQLSKYAQDNNMIVRKSVARNLSILCFGPNVGPAKLALATSQGTMVLTVKQFKALVETGEYPDALSEDISIKEFKARAKASSFEELREKVQANLTGLKEFPRRENLLAIFNDGRAVGWKFFVRETFKDALDIKLTPMLINQKSVMTWTQGHAYDFKRGSFIASHDDSDWANFLKEENAIILQVKYAQSAGFVENQRLTGAFNGEYYKTKKHRTGVSFISDQVEVSSYIYDAGVLTIDIFRPDESKNKIELFDTIILNQVDFVTLLQQGYYWDNGGEEEKIKKVTLL